MYTQLFAWETKRCGRARAATLERQCEGGLPLHVPVRMVIGLVPKQVLSWTSGQGAVHQAISYVQADAAWDLPHTIPVNIIASSVRNRLREQIHRQALSFLLVSTPVHDYVRTDPLVYAPVVHSKHTFPDRATNPPPAH